MKRKALSYRASNRKFRHGMSHFKTINSTYMLMRGGVRL